MASVSLSGCSFFSSLFGGNKTPIELAPTELQDTYNDYMNNNFYVIDGCPTSGNPKLLVVPIWFTDSYKYIPEAQRERSEVTLKNVISDLILTWDGRA